MTWLGVPFVKGFLLGARHEVVERSEAAGGEGLCCQEVFQAFRGELVVAIDEFFYLGLVSLRIAGSSDCLEEGRAYLSDLAVMISFEL